MAFCSLNIDFMSYGDNDSVDGPDSDCDDQGSSMFPQVGVRHGCSFTGFTDSGFTGDTFTVTAGDLNRLVMAL